MSDLKIEKEVQARVEFKIKELLKGIENRVKCNWLIAFEKGSQKHSHYYEAFKEMKGMLLKEMEMSTPSDSMSEEIRVRKRDEAVDKIASSILKRGEIGYRHKQGIVAKAVEEAQYW